ncbi:amidohydrolase family protein [Microbacterium fluvii]
MAAGSSGAEEVDVLVEGEEIVQVGPGLVAADAEIVDCSERIVMPGLVNAHLHTWQTGLRSIGADWTLSEYLSNMHGTIAGLYRPADMRINGLAGALSLLAGGTTTVGDWCHGSADPEHSDAAIEGLKDSGIRGVFLHGTPYRAIRSGSRSELDRLIDTWHSDVITIGMAIRGPQLSPGWRAADDMRAAAERGIVASMHQSGGVLKPAWRDVRDARLFGPLTNIAHGAGLDDEWLSYLVDAGATFTTTTENELGQGHGRPITARLLSWGTAPSLGTDTSAVVGDDLFSIARTALAIQRSADHEQHRRDTGIFAPTATVTARQALEWATVEGARALGLGDRVGRLEPGLQADLIVLDARAANLWPAHDAVAAALQSSFGNVESVMVAGKWRKRDHHLIGIDVDRVRVDLQASADRILRAFTTTNPLGALRKKIVNRVGQAKAHAELRVPRADEDASGS